MNGLFITGTDTHVGKTALGALLLAELRRRNMNAAPMKPAQTGCYPVGGKPDPSCLSVPDLDYSLSMASMKVDAGIYEVMSPYRFEPACSPHLAAEMAGVEIDIAEIVIAARTLTSAYDFVIAEGAGGILVPLNQRESMLDLMHALGYPVLLAARPGLGTINHTLLSLRTLRSDGLNIAGVVFVASTADEPGFIEKDNAIAIEHFGKVPVLGTIPYCSLLTSSEPLYTELPESAVTAVEQIVNHLKIEIQNP
jgi:dethiobiotin synthetase